jgi:hypothetical protein
MRGRTRMETYEEWRKKRERGLLVLALVPSIFLLISVLLVSQFASGLPTFVKYNAYAIAFVAGVAITGPKGMRKVTYTEEDLLAGYSALVMMSMFFFFFMNGLYLIESGVLRATVSDFLLYFSVVIFPTAFPAMFLTYEILDSRRVKQPLLFRFKRVFGRMACAIMFWIGCLISSRMFSFFTSSEYIIIFVFVIVEIVVFVLVLQFREFFESLLNGDW